ncbi:WASH complex subunit 2-like isoform X2 [Populus alba x Populus x berolinensis]|uniref:WASH complex subunit 2-like isoform X2 n=1 Tax=Populus alba x Populus x berolinensis TaxID=444605 RepID=A0AAD6W124_9ROSI|nr:WASH complex subunit 2-like isoform X2 [Populus alba x Populus x berolinensis]
MASNSSDKELEQQLLEAGNKLLNPPPSVDELLSLLDQVENCLSKVEQSPLKSMQNALSPSQNALVTDQLFRHSNIDVKVAVASCISEITRITAPDAPYDDDRMKEVFQLIVSSFENLDDKSSQSYVKRASILETVAKVRSCVVMLDLECDALIIEMFQHFFKAIRDYHPEDVFSSMETIMSLVLEESEDISVELLSLLLASVKKGDEEVLPVARRLGEEVLESCAAKVKPYLIETVKSLGVSLDDYSDIVGSICQEISGSVGQNDVHAVDENTVEESKPVGPSSDAAASQVNEEETTEVATPEQAEPANDKCPKSAVSNGVTQMEEDDSADLDSMKKQEDDNKTDQLKSIDLPSNAEPDFSNAERVVLNTESEAEQTRKKSEKSPTKLAEPSESSCVDSEKKAEELPGNKIHSEDVPGSPHKDQPVEEAISSENVKETGSQPPSPKALEGDSVPVASPSVSENLPDESFSRKGGRAKKKESLNKHSAPSSDDVPNKLSDGTSDSEAKLHKCSGKEAPAGTSSEDKTPMTTDASKKESDTTGEPEAKPLKQSSKKVDTLKESDTTNEPEAKARKQSSKKVDASKKESDTSGEPETKLLKQSSKKVDASKKESNTTDELEAKLQKQSSKKAGTLKESASTNEPEAKARKQSSKKVDASKKESNTTDESEAKSLKQSSKKVDGSSNNNNDGSTLKQSGDKKRQSHGKAVSEKHVTKSLMKDDDKEKTHSTKSAAKSAKEEHHLEETPVTSTKRKRAAGDEKAPDIKEFDENVVGSKVKVWWPKDRQFYEGKIISFDSIKKKHKVLYTDGDEEVLILKRQKFEFIGDDSESDKEEAADHSSPETSSETPLKKRMKTNSDKSTKQGKGDDSSKRGSGASSSKSKSSAAKSGGKSKEVSKTGGKSIDDSKVKKSDDHGKNKDHTPKSGSKSDVASETASKSKNDDLVTSKASKSKEDETSTPKPSKSKQETPKTGKSRHDTPKVSSNTKGKASKSGGKSNVTGAGKLKSGSSKVKEIDDEETSTDSDKAQQIAKVKMGSSSKGQGSEAVKSGKKRRRT